MSLTYQFLYTSQTASIAVAYCRPHDATCGPDEWSPANRIAFPLRGTFLKHDSQRHRMVADPCHAIFFAAQQTYRVSHPAPGGDDCFVIEPSYETMWEVLDAERFPQTYVALDAGLIRTSRLLWYRLRHGIAGSLEADETALQLFAGSATAHSSPITARRTRDMIEATKITLAAEPGKRWSLDTLARRVHSSPFYLARTFRRIAGMPLHRFQLQARMAAALVQVLDSSVELGVIGIELGFSSHSHFTNTFRRTFGITPAALRKEGKILTAR
jgi:AraC-like DNA-binding protein